MKRRILIMLVALCLAICAAPTMAFAESNDNTNADKTQITSASFTLSGYGLDKTIEDITVAQADSNVGLQWDGSYGAFQILSTSGNNLSDFLSGIITGDDAKETFKEDTSYFLGVMLVPEDGYAISSGISHSDISLKIGNSTIKAYLLATNHGQYMAVFSLPPLTSGGGETVTKITSLS